MELTSTAFENEDAIPVRFTCDGDGISPALALAGVPADAQSLALIMEDPDAPNGTWDHWIAYDIPVTDEIAEDVGELGTAGTNSWGLTGYGGPCPPSGTHRYFFTIYALDSDLGLDEGATKDQVLGALNGRILAEGILMGTYSR
ncbi:MAG: YbhB/YbcL family Raf kinase inhibitor-like protein [Acidimicrobiia bacterium]